MILLSVPQFGRDSLAEAQQEGLISTAPLIKEVYDRHPNLRILAFVILVFVVMAISTSFLTLSVGYKHMLCGLGHSFYEFLAGHETEIENQLPPGESEILGPHQAAVELRPVSAHAHTFHPDPELGDDPGDLGDPNASGPEYVPEVAAAGGAQSVPTPVLGPEAAEDSAGHGVLTDSGSLDHHGPSQVYPDDASQHIPMLSPRSRSIASGEGLGASLGRRVGRVILPWLNWLLDLFTRVEWHASRVRERVLGWLLPRPKASSVRLEVTVWPPFSRPWALS